MKYRVAFRHDEGGFSVWVPGLPGRWSRGATEQEALDDVRDAIAEYLAARDELPGGAEVRDVEAAV